MDKLEWTEFKPGSKAEWKAKVATDLKGEDPDQLVWETSEGLTIPPFYAPEDRVGFSTDTPFSFEPLLNPSKKSEPRAWSNLVQITVVDPKEANQKALKALNQGAEGIIFALQNAIPEFDVLIKDIILSYCPLYFTGDFTFIAPFYSNLKKLRLSEASLAGGFLSAFPTNSQNAFSVIEKEGWAFKTCCVKSDLPYGEEKPIQQLQHLLQQAVRILDLGTEQGVDPKTILDSFIISMEMGNSYFLEIAKLRACRLLICLIASGYKVENYMPEDLVVHCRTSGNPGLESDFNMISNTTQAMSAILGGCNSLYVQPHEAEGEAAAFSQRIARNISLILKEEAFFDKVTDPVRGSYYIEQLTIHLVEKAWEAFLTK